MESFKAGEVVGTGADIDVELGWIPDRVEVYNASDGTPFNVGFPNRLIIPFSGGGSNQISAGDKITGQTSGATAIIAAVLLWSGTWASSNAAGVFVVERQDIDGTFGSENIAGEVAGATDDATVTVQLTHGYTSAGAVAAANASIVAYVGVAGSNAKGFTIATAISTDNKLLRWCAQRNDR